MFEKVSRPLKCHSNFLGGSLYTHIYKYGKIVYQNTLLLAHYGAEKPAYTVDGDEYTKKALIPPDIRTEWKTFQSYLSKQPKGTLYSQFTELTTNEMLITIQRFILSCH